MHPNRATSASTSSPSGGYLIGDLVIEPRLRRIRHPDGELELTQRVFDLLLVFVTEPFTLHARETLFERIWGTLHIEDTNLTQNISVLRRALGGERKHWIRTVSGVGYSFEPPCDVRCFDSVQALQAACTREDDGDALPSVSESPTSTISGAADTAPSTARPSDAPQTPESSPGRRRPFATALLLALAIIGSIAATGSTPRSATVAAASIPHRQLAMSVVITEPEVPPASSEQRATRLLREWVRWKLALVPSINLVEEGNLIAGRSTPSYFLDIALQPVSGSSNDLILDVAFKPVYREQDRANGNATRRIRIAARDRSVPAMLDAASDDVLAMVLPHRRDDRWPMLALDAETADRFADAARASHAGKAQALPLLEQVVAAAPEFGPARHLLAREMLQRRQFRAAAEQARLGRELTTPLPADAAAVLDAETASAGRTAPSEALSLYARLSAASPSRPDFVLAQALILQRDSRPEAAFRLLSRPEWEHEGGRLRIRQLVARAETAFTLGDLEQSEHSTSQALERLQYPPRDLPTELAAARMAKAFMWTQRYQTAEQVGLFAQAAEAYEAAGHRYDADIARFHQAAFGDDIATAGQRLRPLLAMAREHGDSAGAASFHRTMAFLYLEHGDRTRGVKMLEDGLESMRLAGEVANGELLDMDLLGEDLQAGRFRQAAARVERLRDNRLWTHYRYRTARYESDLLAITGRYRQALASLDRTLGDRRRIARWDMSTTESADIACWRMEVLARIGELDAARAQSRGCSNQQPARAMIVEAWIAHLSGDTASAVATLRAVEGRIAEERHEQLRTYLTADLAALKIRLGDPVSAIPLLERLHAGAVAMGDDMLRADIELGLAEAAAARGDWDAASRYLTQSRARLSPDIYTSHRRIDVLDIAALRAQGRLDEARLKADRLRSEARRNGDAVLLSEVDAAFSAEMDMARR
ncbi:MAG: winged helix-turn-helix domain-containing protein [Xanthomonadaceae bacterium]|nr:winged helix-turn-helix domain-containing protein [Xanthomonadaceae bacterium]